MLFNSFSYLLCFFPVVLIGDACLRRWAGIRAARVWLLAASLFFYAFPRPADLPLFLLSILFNWAVIRWMMASSAPESRRTWLWLGLVVNLGFLASFKYVNFGLNQINLLWGSHWAIPNWSFPLGISFFTLTQVMYLIDCFQEMDTPISLFDQASVVSFFPYVSSGPVVRVRQIADQFLGPSVTAQVRQQLYCRGLFLFALGLVKKVVFADAFSAIADAGFGSKEALSCVEAWSFSLAFTFQIYFDFSGYSDMAVGAAWLLGFEIPQNFNAPYVSKSISEFWQRWHISLSNFITNYLYTPILRSFGKATLRTSAVATLLAMGIAGLWHGPGWTYILFGLIHGMALALNQYWKKSKRRLPQGVGWLVTFLLVNASFVVFRSPTVGSAWTMLMAMVPHGNLLGTSTLATAVSLSPSIFLDPVWLGIVLAFFFPSSWDRARSFQPTLGNSLATAALLIWSLYCLNSSVAKQFVYFAF